MPTRNERYSPQSRGHSYAVLPSDIARVICHRQQANEEQYLVEWTRTAYSQRSIYSWHNLNELRRALRHVQTYVDNTLTRAREGAFPFPGSRKRKSPGADPLQPLYTHSHIHDGLLTPSMSRSHSGAGKDNHLLDKTVHHGYLERKAGQIKAHPLPNTEQYPTVDLPTRSMTDNAKNTQIVEAQAWIWNAFRRKLKALPNVRLQNHVDQTTPSLNFTFIDSCMLGEDVYRAPPETYPGCQKCKPDMGQNCGCEYTAKCDCLEFADVDEERLLAKQPEIYTEYKRQKDLGQDLDTTGLPKRFPYTRASKANPARLVSHYRESRQPVYECNQNCKCGPRCKSRLVQHGRTVPLTIFKTPDRGWGVKCDVDLVAGQFIDTYRGEIITNHEADLREDQGGAEKESYLYSLDKFVGDDPDLTSETCYVIDGQYVGGPTRFINHSCEPNCRQYTICLNKYDLRIYDIAFFAYENIPAGTELTFDYQDEDEVEEDEARRRREIAEQDPESISKIRCNCGKVKCRGFLWSPSRNSAADDTEMVA